MKIIVALSAHPKMGVLLNTAARRAAELGVDWTVVYVETPIHHLRGEEHQQAVLRSITKAQEMGAHIRRVEARRVDDGITTFFEEIEGPAELFIGKSPTVKRGFFKARPLYLRLQSKLDESIIINPVPLLGRSPSSEIRGDIFRLRAVKLIHLLYASVSVFCAYIITELIRTTMSAAEFNAASYNTNIVFMLPPVFIAIRYGLIPGMTAALLGFLAMNYFYIEPIYKLDVVETHDMINAILFFGTTLIMALVGSYSNAYADSVMLREKRTQVLFSINEVISESDSRDKALENIHETISEFLQMDVAIFLPPILNPEAIEVAYASELAHFSDYENYAIEDSWKLVRTTGCGTPRFSKSHWRFEPMITGHDRFGVLGVHVPPKCSIDATFGQLVAALADQAGNILHRLELSKEVEQKRISEEREKLRSMLLSSVSHDLKTPLASIIGSLSVYHGMFDTLPDDKKRELTETALDEAQRLDSFITNILDMTRLESGSIDFKQEWEDPVALVKRVKKRLKQRLRHHTLTIKPLDAPIEIQVDAMMTEQVIQNLLDNAAKYTPAGSDIFVEWAMDDNSFCLRVRDSGAGIPEDKLAKIFDKYERLRQQDSKVAGTGLGLAITKAVMEGQDGSITVENHEQGGAVFTLTFKHFRLLEEGVKQVVS
ncbi:MAG: ATP-binding protein [Rickettsiales bacterium]|nr:ATP-binding protein [Rickettsiales bacterium]